MAKSRSGANGDLQKTSDDAGNGLGFPGIKYKALMKGGGRYVMKLLDWFSWYISPAELVALAVLAAIFYWCKKAVGRFILAAGMVAQALGVGIQKLTPISSIPSANQGLTVPMNVTPPAAWRVGYGLTVVGLAMIVLGFALVVYREVKTTRIAREQQGK